MPNHFPVGRIIGAVVLCLLFSFSPLLARQQAPDNKVAAIHRVPEARSKVASAVADAPKRSGFGLRPVTIYYRSYAPKAVSPPVAVNEAVSSKSTALDL